MPEVPGGTRTRVRRQPKRAAYDRAAAHAVLDAALICHVGFAAADQPFVIPMLFARVGERLLLHGSVASRLMRHLGQGCNACVTVTLLDGIVVARSAFHSSANYRSVVAFGRARTLEGPAKRRALDRLVERLIPGHRDAARGPDPAELAATTIVGFRIEEVSTKSRSGPPSDAERDLTLPVWAGVIPLSYRSGVPIADERSAARPLPEYVRAWRPPG